MAQNFQNLLQSMSNSAASNVSAPVDGLAWLLRKAGVPVPRNALLGSDWMAERGLTRPVPQGAASVAGETLGLLAPMAAAAKAPQIAGGLLAMERNALAPRTITGPSASQRGVLSMENTNGARRMAEAQRNAAKPVSEGGLGLGPNNTAAERAQAMGFDTPLYRGAAADEAGRTSFRGGGGEYGMMATDSPNVANAYAFATGRLPAGVRAAPNVQPLLVKLESPSVRDFGGRAKQGDEIANMLNYSDDSTDAVIARNLIDHPQGREDYIASDVYSLLKPQNIRSRFAAFDPLRSKESSLLASLAAMGLLGAGANPQSGD